MTDPKPISDWKLERFALGELGPDESRAVEARLQADPELRARLERLQASNQQVLEALPPERVLPEVRRRAAFNRNAVARPARSFTWAFATPVLASAAVAALVLVARPHGGASTDPRLLDGISDVTRDKGLQPHLIAYRMRDGQAQRLEANAPVHAGEALQLAYVAAGRRFGVVLSVDGRGAVTVHLPEGSARAAALQPATEVTLPNAYELDDAPAFERFFFITSAAPFDAAPVVAAARALASRPDARERTLELPAGLEQSSFTVQKVQP